MMTLWLVCLFVLVPLELGILFWQGKKHNGKFSLAGIVLNREKTPLLQFALWTFAALAGAVLCFVVFGALDGALQKLFSWLPGWFFFNSEDLSGYSKNLRIINWLGVFLVTGIIGPFLFALYHFWSPWQLVSRFLAVLPLVYIVNWKKDLRIGVAAHWILNTVGSLELLFAVFR